MQKNKSIHKDFWNEFLKIYDSSKEFKESFNRRTALERDYHDLYWGERGIHICLKRKDHNIIYAELYIEDNKDIFYSLLEKREIIDRDYNDKLMYKNIKKHKSAHVYITKHVENLDDREEWNSHIEWMVENSMKLKTIYNKYITNKSNLNNFDAKADYKNLQYNEQIILKSDPIINKGKKTYCRNKKIVENALAISQYKCEIDNTHWSFIKKNGVTYMESHHLIPMAYQDNFEVSLDREQNIICLCSTCHRMIHYGKDAKQLLKQLYSKRKKLLEKIGIKLTLDELLNMYNQDGTKF